MYKGFITDLFLGLYFGYNKCCIFNFIRLAATDKLVAEYMWTMHGVNDNHNMVFCHKCYPHQLKPVAPARREEYYEVANRLANTPESIEEYGYFDIKDEPR